MINVKADMCSCCQEVWNQVNLTGVSLGEHNLYLCPDCFKELQKMIDNKKSEHGDKTSHWIRRGYMYNERTIDMLVCSACRAEFSFDYETGVGADDWNFCPHCGAKMKGGK